MPSLYSYYPQTSKISWRGHEWFVEFKDDKAILTCEDVLAGNPRPFNQIAIPRSLFEDILKYLELKESLNFDLSDHSI